LPLGALHNGPEAHQLEGVHGDTHFVTALLFCLASVTLQVDGLNVALSKFIAGPVKRFPKQVAIVSIEARDFGSPCMFGFGLPPPDLLCQLCLKVIEHQRQ